MYCKYCGNDIQVGSAFCLECGRPIIQKEKSPYDRYTRSDFWKQSSVGSILGLLIGVAIWVVLTYIVTTVKGSFDPFNIVVSMFLLIGFALIWDGIFTYRKGKASLKWPTVQGTIEYSRIDEVLRRRSQINEPRRFAKIVYKYDVKGQNYLCNLIRISHKSIYHFSEVKKYPENKTVRVYYNPRKHKYDSISSKSITTRAALLEPGYPLLKTLIYIISGLITLVIGILVYQNMDLIQSFNQS